MKLFVCILSGKFFTLLTLPSGLTECNGAINLKISKGNFRKRKKFYFGPSKVEK